MRAARSINLIAAVAVVGLTASLIVFSIIASGASAVTLSAHDDGAWLLDQATGTALHASGAGQEIDSAPQIVGDPSSADGLQLFQYASVAVVLDGAASQIKVIDPSTRSVPTVGGITEVEEGVVPLVSATGLYFLHPDGRVRFQRAGSELPAKLTDADWEPGPGPDLVGASATDGSVWMYSRTTGALWYYGDKGIERFTIRSIEAASLTIVGLTPVLLAGDGGTLIVAGDTERPFEVGLSEGAVLQLPSAAATPADDIEVLVADGSDVKAISLNDGTVTTRFADVGGDQAAPAVFGGCVHAFSQQTGLWARACGGGTASRRTLAPGAARFRLVNDRLWLDNLRVAADYFVSNDYEPVKVAPDEADSTASDADLPSTDSAPNSSPTAETGGGAEAAFGLSQVIDGTAAPDAVNDDFGSRGDAVLLPVLHNDSDKDLDPLVVTEVVSSGSGGTFQVAPGGTAVTFTPDESFGTRASATYTISDGRGNDDQATITVDATGDADNTPPTTASDAARIEATRTIDITLLANDWDYEGDAVEVDPDSLVLTAGEASVTPEGVMRYTAPDQAGLYQVSYTAVDSRGLASAPTTVEIIVSERGAPLPPLALADVVYVRAGVPVIVQPLRNDTDPNLDELTVRVDDRAGFAVVADPTNTSITVTAEASGRIIYRAIGRGEESNQASIRVEVIPEGENRPPVAVRDNVTVTAGRRAQLNAVDVLRNDSDPDGDRLVASLITESVPAAIGVVNAGNGRFEIDVVDATATTATFRYMVDDGRGETSTSSVRIRIRPPQVNQAPVAVDDDETVRAGTTTSIDVLANDSDPEGAPIKVSAVDDTVGWIAIGDTLIVTVPADTPAGTEQFRYTIVDDQGLPAEADLNLTILPADAPNRAPVAIDDAATTAWNDEVAIFPLSNDTDPDGDSIFIESAGGSSYGSIEVIDGSYLRYTPFAGTASERTDTFGYSITDGEDSVRASITVQLTPPATTKPEARRPPRRSTGQPGSAGADRCARERRGPRR